MKDNGSSFGTNDYEEIQKLQEEMNSGVFWRSGGSMSDRLWEERNG